MLSVLQGCAIVAHNAHHDVGVLSRELGDWEPPEVFDTLKLARRFLPGQESYRLGALADDFKLAEALPDGLEKRETRLTGRPAGCRVHFLGLLPSTPPE